MAFTDFCDIFGAVEESAFNSIVFELQRQRPSLFNYGTTSFVKNPKLFCNQKMISEIDPDVTLFENPIVTVLPLLGIPGYAGPEGLEYCLQLSELSIDFHPSNIHNLPSELHPPLKDQHFSLKARVCGGIACASSELLLQLDPGTISYVPGVSYRDKNITHNVRAIGNDRGPSEKLAEPIPVPTRPLPFSRRNVLCFCIDLFVVLHMQRDGSGRNSIISLQLDNLELVDIKPDGLENSIECYLKTLLILSVLPKVKFALSTFVFNIGDVLTIEPTPLSPHVPNNPAIEEDEMKVFISLIV